MKAERKSSRLRQILDETAEQMCFLSHLDEKSARLLTDEVISENDLIEKTHKLLHIMIDEISTMKMNNAQSQSSSTAFLYAMLSKSNRNVPIDGDELMKWIPAKIDEYRRQIHELKQVTEQQRNEIDNLKKECKQRSESPEIAKLRRELNDQKRLSTENPNGTEIARMKKKLERKTKKVALLKKELDAVKSGDKEDLTHIHSQIDRLKGVVQTLKNQLSDINSGRSDTNEEVEKLQKENQELKNQLEAVSETRTSEELKTLREKYSIVIAELRSVKDENVRLAHQLKCHNDAAQERHDAMKHIEIEKDSLSSKLMDALNQTHELEEKLKALTMEKERLSHQCIRLEATLSKERDALTSRVVTTEGDLMNLQRFGFLLADALGEEFNPSAVETELNRLIAIAGRGREEPFFVPPAGNKDREYHRIHTQFDELESQISALQSTMQTCT